MGKLYVVATPIGNLNDISKRAIDTLNGVDLILCEDTRHSIKLLNYYNIKKKLISYHKFNEQKRSEYIVNEIINNDKNIALISDAGTPLISDPGYIIVKLAREKNIEVIGIPGPSAVITALSVCGFDTKGFSFYGFFPRIKKEKELIIKSIKKSDINVFIFYESPKRIVETIKYLKNELSDFNIIICSDLTKLHEKHYWGKIDDVLNDLANNDKNNLGEYTIIIEYKSHKIESNLDISIESKLIDLVIKKKITLKEAIKILTNNTNFKKNEIYNASLNLKKIVEKLGNK